MSSRGVRSRISRALALRIYVAAKEKMLLDSARDVIPRNHRSPLVVVIHRTSIPQGPRHRARLRPVIERIIILHRVPYFTRGLFMRCSIIQFRLRNSLYVRVEGPLFCGVTAAIARLDYIRALHICLRNF